MSKKTSTIKRLRDLAIERQSGRCFYCRQPMIIDGVRLGHNLLATAEHLIKKADGGKYNQENIVAAHGLCNMRRGERTVDEYLEYFKGYDRKYQFPKSAVFWCE